MSEKVKLIIEIDKRAYKGCQKLRTNDDDGIVGLCAVNAIANGIPLDDVKEPKNGERFSCPNCGFKADWFIPSKENNTKESK